MKFLDIFNLKKNSCTNNKLILFGHLDYFIDTFNNTNSYI